MAKRFCDRNCSIWAKRNPPGAKRRTTCDRCADPLPRPLGKRHYCSAECSRLAGLAQHAARAVFPVAASCARCEKEFLKKKHAHRHCSARCYQRDYLEAHPEKRPPPWAFSTRRRRLPPDWEKRRQLVLERDPVCKVCSAAAAAEVDHIERGEDHSIGNLQGICCECHKVKTQREAQAAKEQMRRRARAVLVG